MIVDTTKNNSLTKVPFGRFDAIAVDQHPFFAKFAYSGSGNPSTKVKR